MADTTTPVLGLVRQTIGGNRNTWGAILNSCMDLIEGAFYGLTSVAVTGASDVTLTDTQRRKRILVFSGALTADQNIIIANLVGRWTVRNATTGAFKLKIKTPSGTAVEIPQGGYSDVWCDGADNMFAGLSTRLRDTQLLVPDGTLAAPGLSWATEVASGFYRVSAGVFAWVVAGIARVAVSATSFAITLDDTGAATITVDTKEVFRATETGVAVNGTFTVGGQAPVPVGFGGDYEGIFEPNGWKFRNGQELNRVTHALLFEVLTVKVTATRTNSTVLNIDKNLVGAGLEGALVEGPGVPSGTVVAGFSPTSVALSQVVPGTGDITMRFCPHGNGDGVNTFNVPDDCGRVNPGRDNMGGISPKNRLTGKPGGINGSRFGATGGSETVVLTRAQIPTGLFSLSDPGHRHATDFLAGATPNGAPPNPYIQALNSTGGTIVYTTASATGISLIDNAGNGEHNNVMPSRVNNKIIFTGLYT